MQQGLLEWLMESRRHSTLIGRPLNEDMMVLLNEDMMDRLGLKMVRYWLSRVFECLDTIV